MADHTKTFIKKNSDRIPDGERVIAALIGASKGSALRHGVQVGAGGLLGAVAGAREAKAQEKLREELAQTGDTDAAAWPEGNYFWLVLTDQHLRVFQGTPGSSQVGASTYYSIDRIASLDFDKKMVLSKLGVCFKDGTRIDLDVGKQKFQPFLDEFGKHVPVN
ncbi:MAG TPA: hypothetical protein VJ927_05200 [Actinomycetota bacterium]|nr:hypothetical protein [Actinomycetota bacterium]